MPAPYARGRKVGESDNKVNAEVFEQELRGRLKPQFDRKGYSADNFNSAIDTTVKKMKPTFGGGVCLALVCKWAGTLFQGGANGDGAINTEQCKSVCKQAQSRYQTNVVGSDLAHFVATGKDAGADGQARFQRDAARGLANGFNVTLAGRIASGVLENSVAGPEGFGEQLTTNVLWSEGTYLFRFAVPQVGGHVMGLHVTTGRVVLFDPNYGFYEYTAPTDCEYDLRMVFYGWEAVYRPAIGGEWSVTRLLPRVTR